jgi:hypothetical protein
MREETIVGVKAREATAKPFDLEADDRRCDSISRFPCPPSLQRGGTGTGIPSILLRRPPPKTVCTLTSCWLGARLSVFLR